MKNILFAASLLLSINTINAVSPVTSESNPDGALSGRNIALWQSHGRYYDAAEDRWKWQRCRLFGTVEDIYTRSYVVPYLVPMLENAGAYVMLPRERDANPYEVVIDNPTEHNGKHKWHESKTPGFAVVNGVLTDSINPFTLGTARYVKTIKDAEKASTASWRGEIPETGEYAVYVSYPKLEKAITDAKYTVHTAVGDKVFSVNQKMSTGTWVYLGTFPFAASKHSETLVSLSNVTNETGEVGADAVRIGGGMGNVARNGQISGMPRWAEASRYWLQYAGMPDSVYANQEGDYRDDIFCRPQWVNYMRDELNVPIDLIMAFHSDAGTLGGDSIVGTLGIYYTQKKRGQFTDGRTKMLNEKLAKSIVNSVVGDIRQNYDSRWEMRKLKDAKYVEARVPEVPTMLLELLSHQNLTDMRYGLDPQFKFDVSRAVYKGILRYLADQKLAKYIVQPLAPSKMSLTEISAGRYRLSWKPTTDPLEPTAMPTHYIVEAREGEFFKPLCETAETELFVEIPEGKLLSYRVIATNGGGQSFPSEILAAGYVRNSKATVTVVNGFTRIAAPDVFVADSLAGFGLSDPGVADGINLAYTGAQYDFDRSKLWVHDDQPGFGASLADMEMKPVFGNSFDYVVTHGRAIMAAGYSFDSQSVGAFANSDNRPDLVDLILGLQKETKIGVGERPSAHHTFPIELQNRLSTLADNNVPMFVSGSYIASDSKDNESIAFLQKVLGIKLRSDRGSSTGSVSEVKSIFSSYFQGGTFTYSTILAQQPYAVTSPDAIIPGSTLAATFMRYDDNQSSAAVAFSGASNKVVTLGFPFEAVTQTAKRQILMNQILNFLYDTSK
ncbi:MAG: N-acetylmuramoyl-L-alanine amidase [Bacteroides sp.]|nr:N-acetylmuramoyl-L-alanine amidase [Bacteroides sp.]MCM1379941.1 N-acetylmuramoyl-L-alanine amidase [Bacteroides sp.]MCM1446204.1 N-acetylmuramoyl-L-alanine amidase [Prevotella sp.]